MDRATTSSGRPQVIDIIVVAYRDDTFLLELQARSILLYFPVERISNIYICVNDEDSVCNDIDTDWYKDIKHKVKIIPRSKFGVDPTLDGWRSQQLYKLLLANQAESPWSLCLDSKTCFVKQFNWNLWFDNDGRVNVWNFPTITVFKSAQDFIETYFNIICPLVIGPGGVPFAFHTETVKSMCQEIPNFFNFFCKNVKYPAGLTEFMLYTGYVLKKYQTLNKLYSDNQYYSFFNLADWQVKDFDTVWKLTKNENLLTASIQQRAYPHLSDEQFNAWINFLQSKNLLTTHDPIAQKLNTLR